MKNRFIVFFILVFALFEAGCSTKNKSQATNNGWPFGEFPAGFGPGGMKTSSSEESIVIEDYVKYVSEDEVERVKLEKTLEIVFNGTKALVDGKSVTEEGISVYSDSEGNDVKVYLQKAVYGADAEAPGVYIEYKGKDNIKYSLSGSLEGTLKISNKKADCVLELNGVNINSSNLGPVLHITSDSTRTFICVMEGTENTFVDNRLLDSGTELLNDKKASVYAKGALIFSGSTSRTSGGKLSVINKGYKHGIYSHDYVRIWDINLDVNCEGKTSRDCIRTLNAVIINGGNINLVSNGSITDDEGCGIKVEGEDADEEKKQVEYTAGAGFIVINGGNIKSTTVSKGMTAHWKSSETFIGNEEYKEIKNTSLLYGSGIFNGDAETPQPYLVINGGSIEITTTGEPYETQEASCSPEGLEAKLDLVINNGTVILNTTDDSLNASGSIVINDGYVYAVSSKNDAIDTNGPSGITINGGVVFAKGVNIPECAFDCDDNPFVINGGVLVGFGSSNYSKPSDKSSQKVMVLGAAEYAGKSLVIIQNGKVSFACHVPMDCGEVIVLSSPSLVSGNYEILSGSSVSGLEFKDIFVDQISYSGGTRIADGIINGNVSEINVPSFRGGRGGDGFGDFPGEPPEGFDGKRPEGFPDAPPEGFNGKKPDDKTSGFPGKN